MSRPLQHPARCRWFSPGMRRCFPFPAAGGPCPEVSPSAETKVAREAAAPAPPPAPERAAAPPPLLRAQQSMHASDVEFARAMCEGRLRSPRHRSMKRPQKRRKSKSSSARRPITPRPSLSSHDKRGLMPLPCRDDPAIPAWGRGCHAPLSSSCLLEHHRPGLPVGARARTSHGGEHPGALASGLHVFHQNTLLLAVLLLGIFMSSCYSDLGCERLNPGCE